MGGMYQLRGRLYPQEGRQKRLANPDTCFFAKKVTSFLDKPVLQLWSLSEPFSYPYTHRGLEHMGDKKKKKLERSAFSFHLGPCANLYSG